MTISLATNICEKIQNFEKTFDVATSWHFFSESRVPPRHISGQTNCCRQASLNNNNDSNSSNLNNNSNDNDQRRICSVELTSSSVLNCSALMTCPLRYQPTRRLLTWITSLFFLGSPSPESISGVYLECQQTGISGRSLRGRSIHQKLSKSKAAFEKSVSWIFRARE